MCIWCAGQSPWILKTCITPALINTASVHHGTQGNQRRHFRKKSPRASRPSERVRHRRDAIEKKIR